MYKTTTKAASELRFFFLKKFMKIRGGACVRKMKGIRHCYMLIVIPSQL